MIRTSAFSRTARSAILDYLASHGASFFGPMHEAVGDGFPGETVSALWDLVWSGFVTNDTFHALRAFTRARATRRRHPRAPASTFRSRRLAPPSAEGRWTIVSHQSTVVRRPSSGVDRVAAVGRHQSATAGDRSSDDRRLSTAWSAASSQQLLSRHGIVTREALTVESIPGGFSTVYPVLKAMEESGRLRRGYFVTGLGAAQFALPGAVERLRSMRDAPEEIEVAVLAATDPANPYGATLRWPTQAPRTPSTPRKARTAGTRDREILIGR